MIEIKNVSFHYPSCQVFKDLSLNIKTGGIYGLLGPNGQGKSTLLYLISGLLRPKKGEVLMNGISTGERLPSTLSDIFIVPEEFMLPPISMKEYCKINAAFYPRFSMAELTENLNMFGIDPNKNMSTYSMGQKKKAFLSFALACNTSVLLLDEPTNGLDITSKSDFRRFIASNMTDDRSIIISTHQIHDVELLLDHIIMLGKNGQPVIDCSTSLISEKLSFTTGLMAATSGDILFSQPTFGGNNMVKERKSDEPETEINLELLYELASSRPEVVNEILSK